MQGKPPTLAVSEEGDGKDALTRLLEDPKVDAVDVVLPIAAQPAVVVAALHCKPWERAFSATPSTSTASIVSVPFSGVPRELSAFITAVRKGGHVPRALSATEALVDLKVVEAICDAAAAKSAAGTRVAA